MPDFDFSTLITDRSPEDLQALRDLLATPMSDWTAEQLAQFNQAASKGAYNYTDLNRVTACMDYLNERLTTLGYVTGYHPIIVHPATPPEPVGPLPEGYTQLEYIESTGTQWIDTGITPTQDYTLYTKVAFLGSSGTNVLGTRDSSNDTTNRFGIISFGASSLFGAFYGTNSVTGKAVDQNPHEFSIGPDGFIMDEETVSVQQTNFSCSYPIILFGFNNGANGIVGAEEKVYSCKIYSDGQLVRDFIPCINPDGIIGLYDKETAIFYQNSGSGIFLKGPELVTLPSGYKQLEYIQSTGTQYIDTGFAPNQDTRIILDAQIQETPDEYTWLYGARKAGSQAAFGFFWNYTSDKFGGTYGSSQVDITSNVGALVRLLVDQNRNQLTFNGQSYTFPVATFQTPVNLPLLARNTNGTLAAYISAKVWSAQLFDDGQLIRDYVPCKNPSNEVGLYDLVNNKFYGNSGIGAFTAGPEIVYPDPPIPLDPYTWYEEDVPTATQMARYLQNVAALRGVLELPEDTAALPADLTGLTQEEANTIEGVLGIIEGWIQNMAAAWFYAGDLYAGEV